MKIGNDLAALMAFIDPFDGPAHFNERIKQTGAQRIHTNTGDHDIAIRGD